MSQQFTSLEQLSGFLDSIPMFGRDGLKAANFNLDTMNAFCAVMGHPEQRLKAVHVAGTNGKGTTCQLLASICQTAGFKTGIYTSPHLVDYRERVRLNGQMIPVNNLLTFFNLYHEELKRLKLTYFEISTALAFWYFDRENVDIAIIETGLGGRLDATNVITPLVSVITSVSLDHMDILGDTIEKIASEKAGIIKPGQPVVIGWVSDEADNVIQRVADELGSVVTDASRYLLSSGKEFFELKSEGNIIKVPRGERKAVDGRNIAICWSVCQNLRNCPPISPTVFVEGVEAMDKLFPVHAHFQKLHSSLNWYFDGAHNEEAIDMLLDEMDDRGFTNQAIIVLSMMRDKATPDVLMKLRRFPVVYYIDGGSPRSADCKQISSILPLAGCFTLPDNTVLKRLDQLKSELVIFAGSFYFYSQVKKWIASLTLSEE